MLHLADVVKTGGDFSDFPGYAKASLFLPGAVFLPA